MPTFQITAPDGNRYRVSGDTQEGALNALQQYLGDNTSLRAPGAPQPPQGGMPSNIGPLSPGSRLGATAPTASKPRIYDMDIYGTAFEVEAPNDDAAAAAARKLAAEMPLGERRVNINGTKVKVDDSFWSLPREQQDATVDEIAQKLGLNKKADDALSVARTGVGGIIEGIPVIGPYIRRGTEMAAAATLAPFSDETYGDIMKRIDAANAAEKAANPWVDTGSQVAGAIGGTIPMVMAAPAAFGGGSGSLMLRSGISALTGTGLGAADAAVRSSGDIDAMKAGAGFGFATGLVGPAAGKLIGSGVQRVHNAIANRGAATAAGTTPRAVSDFSRLAAREGYDGPALQARLNELGPDAMLMDAAPGLQARAGAITAMPGEGQAIVREALAARQAGANGRINAAVEETLGPNVIPSQIDDVVRSGQDALGQRYGEVFANARAVNTDPIANALESQIVNLRGEGQRAAQRVRNMLNINGTDVLDPNPGTLFQTRQAIDGYLATEADPQAIRVYTAARRQVDDMLADAVPQLKEVDAQFAELARQREALQSGQTVLDHGRTAPRPSELAGWITDGVQPQGMQIGPSAVPLRLSQGARAEVDRILGSNANDIAALNRIIKSDGDWNRQRLSSLFGEEKAARLFKALEGERVFADTNQIVTRNSETARRSANMAEMSGGDGGLGFVRQAAAAGGTMGALRGAAITGAEKVWQALSARGLNAANTDMANVLSSRNRALIEAMQARGLRPRSSPEVEAVTRALLLGSGMSGAR